jgi:hypothetical protein
MELKNGTRNCAPFHGALSKLATLGFEVWGCRKWNHMELKNWIYSPRGLPTKSDMGSKKMVVSEGEPHVSFSRL